MKAELVFKNGPENSCLQFYGEYVDGLTYPDLTEAIGLAGWQPDPVQPPPLPPESLDDDMVTSVFVQPAGSGLFGGSSQDEGAANIAKLRKALEMFGIRPGKPRKLTLAEMV